MNGPCFLSLGWAATGTAENGGPWEPPILTLGSLRGAASTQRPCRHHPQSPPSPHPPTGVRGTLEAGAGPCSGNPGRRRVSCCGPSQPYPTPGLGVCLGPTVTAKGEGPEGTLMGAAAAGKEKPAPHASCLASTLAEGGARGRRWGKGPRPLSDTSVENMKKSLRLNLGNNVECDVGRGTGAVVTQRLLCASVTKAP